MVGLVCSGGWRLAADRPLSIAMAGEVAVADQDAPPILERACRGQDSREV